MRLDDRPSRVLVAPGIDEVQVLLDGNVANTYPLSGPGPVIFDRRSQKLLR